MYYFMISSNITNIGTWGRVRLRRATFELYGVLPGAPQQLPEDVPGVHAADVPQHVPEVDHVEEERHGEEEDDVTPSPRMLSGHKMEPRPPCSFVLAQRSRGNPAYFPRRG